MSRVSNSGLRLIEKAVALGYDPDRHSGGPRNFLTQRRHLRRKGAK